MVKTIQVLKTDWDNLGSMIEELYGMAHTTNDLLGSEKIELAVNEANSVENEIKKILDLYNKIETS